MPRIFDNIDQQLLPALKTTLDVSHRADFCVGYFNLRGWRQIDEHIEKWAGGDGECCRLLVGMQTLPQHELAEAYSIIKQDGELDNQTAVRLKKSLAEHFRRQLMLGAPTNSDEAGLRRLAAQIKAGKVQVKLYLRHRLHAKLYMLFRHDPVSPSIGFLGSSNLTFAGLSKQGELNVDVTDHDACAKLAQWFEDRWKDQWCLDISKEIVEIIDQSWARPDAIPPHHIYVKMAYHLCQEAREGIIQHRIPKDFGNKLFDFQIAAVKIAAHHVHKRGGVLLGDVVGLGKTLMATALARILADDLLLETLILCPLNIVPMWEDYCHEYRVPSCRVLSYSKVISQLPELRRYRLIILDESHNLRNREGKAYRVIADYIQKNESKCILLSATPYNKDYLDLASQLRLFVPADKDLGVGPQQLVQQMGKVEFERQHQCGVRTLAAFEKSTYPDDWRELMRLYMVRRTRGFIKENYAETDPADGRKYLLFSDGTRSYFPDRLPKKVPFKVDDSDPNDQYARLYAPDIVDLINHLDLPRYGLGNFVQEKPTATPTSDEVDVLANLSVAGNRLMGFCRTNLFKRLESSGHAFLLSVERHILRNFIYLHAVENNLELPIGTQDAGLLDTRATDSDENGLFEGNGGNGGRSLRSEKDFRERAGEIYALYASSYRSRFDWIRPAFFKKELGESVLRDARALLKVFDKCDSWDPQRDVKLQALIRLSGETHKSDKVLIFSQFGDTVEFLAKQLKAAGVQGLAAATGDSPDVTDLAWRFSPVSNKKQELLQRAPELRVLVATDVLSEGQNLQDCFVIVNYDLPWAIIRLIQRAGRVDRIGQKSDKILCYSFLPADGVERIIRLRAKVLSRLRQNAEVVGTDEAFFDDDKNNKAVTDLYHEKAGLLDGEEDSEIDLASYAYQIWKNAIDADPTLKKTIPDMPNVVFSSRQRQPEEDGKQGVLVYLKTPAGADALAWVDQNGARVTDSQYRILKTAECGPDAPAVPRLQNHHDLVERAVKDLAEEEKTIGGGLGRPSGARFRTYERLKRYADQVKGTLFDTQQFQRTMEDVYKYPLRESAAESLNRQMKTGADDDTIVRLAMALREEGRLSVIHEDGDEEAETQIICSLGLVEGAADGD
ncbi:MAG TPA: phospholipase D-like domain-containing protein [Bryobacteraceae bacterium]|nr:phospholipase D-like domain-containing protein [Bryobacteraceae bacterium]HPT24800.1 phospholipase D-like domain-containing protein [Bryobacteraceae bacterium]